MKKRIGILVLMLCLMFPQITVNAEEKEIPYRLVHDKVCSNPVCISATEQELPQVFKCVNEEEQIYRCIWCDSRAK